MRRLKITCTDDNAEGFDGFADEFAYDGCHKIYVIESECDRNGAVELGYEIRPVDELARVYGLSCPLKFIYRWNLKSVVPQFCEGTVEIDIDGIVREVAA